MNPTNAETFAVVVIFVLISCLSQTSAAVIPASDIEVRGKTENFKLRISEKGTKFVEEIEIDEDKDFEYFKVPAHNGVLASDNFYDFINNMTVIRVKSESKCYATPLPEDLPRPADLKQGLQRVMDEAPSKNVNVVRKQWVVGDQVDKTTLRREVRDLCDQYPVYRLVEFVPDSGDHDEFTRSERLRRQVIKGNLPLCEPPSFPKLEDCLPNEWIYTYKVRRDGLLCAYYYYVSCDIKNGVRRVHCPGFEHLFNSMVCYYVTCP